MSGRIVSLTLKDFQTHEDLHVEFTPGVNCVVGVNNAGKSTIFRAMRWVAFNRPLGDSVLRWGSMDCSARLKTERVTVTRARGRENTYQIGDDEPFRAVGTDVPAEVREALALDEINFQRQIDGPFWITLPAPEIAREMNRVVDLSIIDQSMAKASTSLRDAAAEVKALEGLLKEARLRAGRLNWVKDVEADAREALRCEQEAARKRSEAQTISRVVQAVEEAQAKACAIPDLSKLGPVIDRLRQVRAEAGSLQRLIDQIEGGREELCQLRREIETARKEAEAARPATCPACGQVVQKAADGS